MKKRNLTFRVILIAAVTLLGIWAVFFPRRVPETRDFTLAGIQENLRKNINLGLDLRGGSHLVMRIKVEDALDKLTKDDAIAAENAVKEAKIPIGASKAEVDRAKKIYRFSLEMPDASKAKEISDAVKKKIDLNSWEESVSANTITWSLGAAAQTALSEQFYNQTLKIIETRIDDKGVAEPTLQRHGAATSYQLLLQMPGVQDPERVKKILIAESKLELMRVEGGTNPAPMKTYPTKEEAERSLGGTVPSNRRVIAFTERDDEPKKDDATIKEKKEPTAWIVVENPAIVDGTELRNAEAVSRTGNDDDFQISFSLKPGGAQKFGDWTGKNIGAYMAVVLDNEARSAPFIKSQITDSGEISGRFKKQSAEDLASTLRSGALPAQIEYQEERTVGPSLGADSIRAGVTASAIGVLFVMAFMIFYYRGSGINAVVALFLNMLLTIAGLVWFGATLTLPGIAGLILGIGMAVDSNVLIFERIREEWRAGKSVLQSVDLGFDRAFITIIDTHITTIISSLLLFVFGTGPIRGFAVTLILGLLINLFSAVFVSRTIFIWLLEGKKEEPKTLSI